MMMTETVEVDLLKGTLLPPPPVENARAGSRWRVVGRWKSAAAAAPGTRSACVLACLALLALVVWCCWRGLADVRDVTGNHGQVLAAHVLWRWMIGSEREYLWLLRHKPFRTKVISVGVITFLADCTGQIMMHLQSIRGQRRSSARHTVLVTSDRHQKGKSLIRGFRLDVWRLIKFTLYGLLVNGPWLFLWYNLIAKYGPGDGLLNSLQKCVLEQLVLEPACISNYALWFHVTNRKPMRECLAWYRSEFLGLYRKNAIFWMPANFLNYFLGTGDFRVVFASVCSFFWTVFMNLLFNRKKEEPAKQKERSDGEWSGKATAYRCRAE
ncbi:PXMP2/4 family protein 2 [Porphyridium purpureum]|uniref:PXMP2/4 family protein 2 n=1 Tax=Porphyridium purpureum TaxID=35688 RepID=A0A5J4YZN3_PORPP|nr:PXMP2/4 family protein 2 [Porphyridium purpureum]|eukprot:POR1985..scf208_2